MKGYMWVVMRVTFNLICTNIDNDKKPFFNGIECVDSRFTEDKSRPNIQYYCV